MGLLVAEDLEQLEQRVGSALDSGSHQVGPDGLTILGHGEITLVLGWPPRAPTVAAKRLPPFRSRDRAERYGELVADYTAALATRGVECLESEFHVTEMEGGWAAYVVQPLLDPQMLGPAHLRHLEAAHPDGRRGRELLDRINTIILRAVNDRVGLDGQLSNWAVTPEGLRYFDVTTPLLNDKAGHTRLDLRTLTKPLPAPLRPAVRHLVAPGIVAKYHDPRSVLLDLAANLYKEQLRGWIDASLVSANRQLAAPITPEEVRRYYKSDARTWELMLRLRRADRWWHHHVLHRRYGSLLPLDVDR